MLPKSHEYLVVVAQTLQGEGFLWELKLPMPGGNSSANQWNESRLACANKAVETWVSVKSDTNHGCYNWEAAVDEFDEPDWSGLDFAQLCRLAYKDKIIKDITHPIYKEVFGLR